MAKGNPNRQKMINMMYLVLTALLALNVSKEVLKAFELVNNGLEGTNANFTNKNEDSYANLQKQYELQQGKAKPYYDAAQEVKAKSKAMYDYIEAMKTELVKRGQGYEDTVNKADLKMQSDVEVGHQYFGHQGEQEKMGEKLRAELDKYKSEMAAILSAKGVNMKFDNIDSRAKITQHDAGQKTGKDVAWEAYYFEGYPLIANLVMLTKFQNEVKNSEGVAVKELTSKIGSKDFKFDNLVAIIRPSKSVVLQGQKYEADVFLGAYDSKSNPQIVVNGSPQKVTAGAAKYETTAQGEGVKKVTGQIVVNDPETGQPKPYKFETEYQVFKGSAVISATKMNVVYIGLENPIEVSVPGFPPDKIRATAVGGVLTGSNGKYILKPSDSRDIKTCRINVSVEVEKGKSQQMGTQEYRIKMVPKPVIKFGSIESGQKKSKVELSVQAAMIAQLENFVFEGVKYEVLEYKYYYISKSGGSAGFREGSVRGRMIDATLKGSIASGRAGDIISIPEVRVQGPAGPARTVPGPTIFVN